VGGRGGITHHAGAQVRGQDLLAREELERLRVGRGLGLDEDGPAQRGEDGQRAGAGEGGGGGVEQALHDEGERARERARE
jgi:hypothetical protein